jgi:hypothetical protein
MTTADNVTVAILAGGRSSRMGTDKAFVRVLGRPLIEDVLAQLEGVGSETLIVTNRVEDYRYLGVPLFTDVLPDKGALGGLYSALHAASRRHGWRPKAMPSCRGWAVRPSPSGLSMRAKHAWGLSGARWTRARCG